MGTIGDLVTVGVVGFIGYKLLDAKGLFGETQDSVDKAAVQQAVEDGVKSALTRSNQAYLKEIQEIKDKLNNVNTPTPSSMPDVTPDLTPSVDPLDQWTEIDTPGGDTWYVNPDTDQIIKVNVTAEDYPGIDMTDDGVAFPATQTTPETAIKDIADAVVEDPVTTLFGKSFGKPTYSADPIVNALNTFRSWVTGLF